MKSKIMNVESAVALINDGDTVAISSAGMVGYPEYISKGLRERFDKTGAPKNLTISAGCGHGIPANDELGDSRLAPLLRRYIASHPMTCVPILQRVIKNEIEGYALPQGVLNQLYRASAAKQPGILTKIGLGTYVDPRQDGGRLNAAAKDTIVELMPIHGEDYLFYRAYPVNVAVIRATTADEDGNLSIEEEALKLEILEAALAAKASQGKVIAQVKRVTARGSLKAKDVVVPGELVDAVVVAEDAEHNHRQTMGTYYSPYLSGELTRPAAAAGKQKETLSADDIICRRAVFELYPGAIVNVGIGVGAGLGTVAEAEGIANRITFTLELGSFGGIPTPITDFGAAFNATSYVAHPTMFDYYHGGNLDIAFLGTAEIDKKGNVNVSMIAGRASGQGGFIDISQTSKKTVFASYFRAKGFKCSVSGGRLHIEQEGQLPKFVDTVSQITYSGEVALAEGREAVYITERAVFVLGKDGLTLTEIAPGVDLEKDVLSQMAFKPMVSANLKTMDARIFAPGRMGCFDTQV